MRKISGQKIREQSKDALLFFVFSLTCCSCSWHLTITLFFRGSFSLVLKRITPLHFCLYNWNLSKLEWESKKTDNFMKFESVNFYCQSTVRYFWKTWKTLLIFKQCNTFCYQRYFQFFFPSCMKPLMAYITSHSHYTFPSVLVCLKC